CSGRRSDRARLINGRTQNSRRVLPSQHDATIFCAARRGERTALEDAVELTRPWHPRFSPFRRHGFRRWPSSFVVPAIIILMYGHPGQRLHALGGSCSFGNRHPGHRCRRRHYQEAAGEGGGRRIVVLKARRYQRRQQASPARTQVEARFPGRG
ncbi:unnamed protein product, partial [Ectocarpus fasciculatus]